MKKIGRVIGVLLALSGMIWFFQGIGVLPGSFMSNQVEWAYYGALAIAVGGGLFWFARKKDG